MTAGEKVNAEALEIMKRKYPKHPDSDLYGGLQFHDAFACSVEIVRTNNPGLFEQYMDKF